MNKVESIIKEELGKTLIDLTVKHVKDWVKKELKYCKYTSKTIIIFPLNNKNTLIGNFLLTELDNSIFEVKKEHKKIHEFYNQKAAILYCIFENLKKFDISFEILCLDNKVGASYKDLEFYKIKIHSKQNDLFKRQLYISRYNQSKSNFESYSRELKKCLTNAKYMKIWDKIL